MMDNETLKTAEELVRRRSQAGNGLKHARQELLNAQKAVDFYTPVAMQFEAECRALDEQLKALGFHDSGHAKRDRKGGPMNQADDALYVTLQGGQYWRAAQDIPKFEIAKGTVLLLQSVRDVEGEAHTVIVRPHPDVYAAVAAKYRGSSPGEYRFLVQDFLSKFALEPDYKRIRGEELARIQGRVADLQDQLAEANTNPDALKNPIKAGLLKWAEEQKLLPGTLESLPDSVQQPAMIDQTLTVDKVETMKLTMAKTKEVASIRAGWIKEKVEEIGKTVEAMTPYYQEQAAAALATTEDVRTHVAKLMTGIESLDLYVGTNVQVRPLREGKDAEPEIPLTVMQRKLFMDEELSVWCDIGGEFDFSKVDLFYEALAGSPSLVSQIFPTERCIVCMAVNNRAISYSDNPWVDMKMNAINHEVFLLVRNGENIHLVNSSIESHSSATHLFPSKQEMDDIFVEKGWGRYGEEGRVINFQDVQYTDKLSKFEAAALHYKRFLILMAGLDHRLNLFGTFYGESKGMNFMTLRFQEKYCRYIHDDDGEGMLPLVKRPSLSEWMSAKNEYLSPGSRVMCMWRDVMNPDTAPGAVKYGDDYRHRWLAHPRKSFSLAVAFKEGEYICVKAPVRRDYGDAEFEAKVFLTSRKGEGERHRADEGYLVLDAVKADELETYIHDRESRKDWLAYVRLFKAAVNHLREEEKQEAEAREAMRKAMADGGVGDPGRAGSLIDQAVVAWRAAHRGAALCQPSSPEFLKLLDQIYALAHADRDWGKAGELVESMGRKPLRLVLNGKNTLSVYVTPLPAESDDRLWPMAWAVRIDLRRTKSGDFAEAQRSWRLLPVATASESTLYEWPEASAWKGRETPVDKYEIKQRYFARAGGHAEENCMLYPMTPEKWDEMFNLFKAMRDTMARANRSGRVQNPHCYVPIGLEYNKYKNRLSWIALGGAAHELLYAHAPDGDRREKVAKEYARMYNREQEALERIRKGEEAEDKTVHLVKIRIDREPERYGFTPESASTYDWKFDFADMGSHLQRIIEHEQESHTYNYAPAKAFWVQGHEFAAKAAK